MAAVRFPTIFVRTQSTLVFVRTRYFDGPLVKPSNSPPSSPNRAPTSPEQSSSPVLVASTELETTRQRPVTDGRGPWGVPGVSNAVPRRVDQAYREVS